MKKIIPLLLLPFIGLSMVLSVNGQLSDTIPAQINPEIDSNQVRFQSVLRPLRQIAGAPEAFYSYFWEFGDGSYSFARTPVHQYKDTGEYDVRLFATNNYDDGKKPPTRLQRVRLEKKKSLIAANTTPAFFKGAGSLEIRSSQQPKPGEDMVLLIGYRNRPGSGTAGSGSILLLYNEKQFAKNSFDLADTRTYHAERKIGFDSLIACAPAAETWLAEHTADSKGFFHASAGSYPYAADKEQLRQALKMEMDPFRQHQVWRIEAGTAGTEQFLFLSLNTLPEMIKDTNAVVTITGLFIPDDPALEMEKFNLELPIVASHDPNRLTLKNKRLNYRLTGRNRENTYKIQFQNTGKGPAKQVAIDVAIPGMLSSASIQVTDRKPACTWCTTAYPNQSCFDTIVRGDSIRFIFKNIYLPGTQQEGVEEPDSTMGYVKYTLSFTKGMRKEAFSSSAAIIFDKNEPIYTNRSVGRFKKGLSPGVIVGYGTALGSTLKNLGRQNYTLGFTLSEYSAYKKYFQWELYLQGYQETETFLGRRTGRDTMINGVGYKLEYSDSYLREKVFAFEAVPLELRYNFNSFISGGAGALVAGEFSRTRSRRVQAMVSGATGEGQLLEGTMDKESEAFAEWRGAFFADLQFGRVRVGPALGVRFLQYMNPGQQRLLFYASWKF
ncbi:MAG: PKD domain-containing protein [Candidatus Pseudobacter hemicellulosilyticus]|uniref:PKD domain-containing protein n=1 Tax=Candidatus Pseudobacter hemicellulosilyticus TaxID=3121375 RepID=A0AAJ6BGR1_9BACT|nr:MAG: PKD domain-containing protein [Pseudobacter sp.]